MLFILNFGIESKEGQWCLCASNKINAIKLKQNNNKKTLLENCNKINAD